MIRKQFDIIRKCKGSFPAKVRFTENGETYLIPFYSESEAVSWITQKYYPFEIELFRIDESHDKKGNSRQ